MPNRPSQETEGYSLRWEKSTGHARQFLKERLAKGTIRSNEHVYKPSVVGEHKNEDIFVAS
jgi:hypothetical protein